MDTPGPFQLTFAGSALAVTGPGTFAGDIVGGEAGGPDYSGALAASFQAQFAYGSGGASCTAYIQTSIDQGQTWIDIAAIEFTTAGGTEVVNLSGLTPKTTPAAPTNGTLTAGTTVDGILGDRFRAVVVVSGTYGNSTLLNLTGVLR